MTDKQGYPRILFWFYAAHALLGLLWAAVCLVDLVLHPFVPDFMLQSAWGRLIVGLLIAPGTILIGGLILRRENRNIVGVLLILFGGAMYATTIRSDIDHPAALTIHSYYVSGFIFQPVVLLIFYFPNGRSFPPRLSRWIDIYLLVLTVMWFGLVFGNSENPLYIPAAAVVAEIGLSTWGINFPVLMILMVYSLFSRYRHGDARQRLQMNWIAGIILILFCVVLLGALIISIVPDFVIPTIVSTFFYLALFGFPAFAVGNAILRHKLYDINIIIRRTLIYTILTTILAIIYFGGIILTQQLFRAITGENSDLAIVISTLLIAALFSPVRSWVQDVIDRRLYRRKYDVEQTLAQFQQNLRDQVDVETLKANLIGVVSDTMQPSKIALWVKEENI